MVSLWLLEVSLAEIGSLFKEAKRTVQRHRAMKTNQHVSRFVARKLEHKAIPKV